MKENVVARIKLRQTGWTFFAVIITWTLFLSGVHAWWNEDWEFRKKIALDTTTSGADIQQNQMGFPILIRLHSGNFDFTKAGDNGEDLRFVSMDETTVLKHHIESYDSLDEIALIWVKAPQLTGNSSQGHLWLYYGNQSAVGGEDTKNTFDAQYQAIFHFNEFEGLPKDSSAHGNQPSEYTGGLGLAGVIGNGATFSGSGTVMTIPDSPVLTTANGFSFSAWIKIFSPQDDAYLLSRGSAEKGITVSIKGNKLVVRVADGSNVYETEQTAAIPLEGWHHIAATFLSGDRITLYVDGTEALWMNTKADLSQITGDIRIGSDASGDHSFSGDLDEVRLSGTARTTGWIRALYASQGPDTTLYAYSLEEVGETGSGMPVFYLATIFKNITIDGLLVIGLLLVLSGCSWVVMISKAAFLFFTGRDNKKFLARYNPQKDPVGIEADMFKGSSLYRIYKTGMDNIQWTRRPEAVGADVLDDPAVSGGTGTPQTLSCIQLENFKAALEQGFVEENKRLNSWLIVLTMSISGGPFLGLLGTVWGVMNTFAAMAEAGEANIMAIAPGVASALSTTVFGLIVAIPALFGYNYLAGKIRDITADSGVFVDQLSVKMEAAHGEKS